MYGDIKKEIMNILKHKQKWKLPEIDKIKKKQLWPHHLSYTHQLKNMKRCSIGSKKE